MTLERFHTAQSGVIEGALKELRAGRKRSHWIWFILPQIAGLGRSAMSQRYAISDLAEAEAYLADQILAARLTDCVVAALTHREKSAQEIFGSPDDLKFRSCLTLFEAAAPEDSAAKALFAEGLSVFYNGARDPETLQQLQRSSA
ncbi:MAG: DUF1810 domain-containing protein [Rhodobacteraceae bacterium]|nr:DUF1810 domain-containing protein [Paracoccaceae bacterium]